MCVVCRYVATLLVLYVLGLSHIDVAHAGYVLIFVVFYTNP